MTYTRQLDVLATSAGVIFSNTDRPELETNLIEDLLQQLSNQSDGKPPGSREPERAFAAWTLAHFTSTSSNDPDDPDSQKRVAYGDQKRVAIHEGFEIITKVLTDSKPASLIRRALKTTGESDVVDTAAGDASVTIKLLAKLCRISRVTMRTRIVDQQVVRNTDPSSAGRRGGRPRACLRRSTLYNFSGVWWLEEKKRPRNCTTPMKPSYQAPAFQALYFQRGDGWVIRHR